MDIVLTDPPYFDNIAYSELAEFFLPWMQLVGLDQLNATVVTESVQRELDRTPPGCRRLPHEFTARLSGAFREVARVLKADGLSSVQLPSRGARGVASRSHVPSQEAAISSATQVLPAPGEAGVGLHAPTRGTGLWDADLRPAKGTARRHDDDLRV